MSEPDEDEIYESFAARRRKQERRGQPVVYQYEVLPRPFLVQVVQILERAIGSFETRRAIGIVSTSLYRLDSISPHDVWKGINTRVAFDAGVFDLDDRQKFARDKFASFLLNASGSTNLKLTAIEHAFQIVKHLDRLPDSYKQEYGVIYSPAEAAAELNSRFGEHDLGYKLVADEIVRVDSELLHSEVVEPTVNILQVSGFSGALDELLRAYRHYRLGETQDAIVDANNAFESTMKTICERSGITLAGTETAEQLIKMMTGAIIPRHLESSLQALRKVMETLPTLRNRTAGAGHGQGSTEVVVLDHLAGYALNLAATNILFLVESWQEKDAKRASSR